MNQQHSQLVQQVSLPAWPSAHGAEQYSFPSFSTADCGSTLQLQGSQEHGWVVIGIDLAIWCFFSRQGLLFCLAWLTSLKPEAPLRLEVLQGTAG